ncbi:MAG: hypothetical protein ACLP5V_05175 [Candidatus Bathyarchaeia archaeon]
MDQVDETTKGCACGAGYSDLMSASPPKKDWFRKTTCPRCGKVYWTNRDKEADYCTDCEPLAVAQSARGD